MIHPDDQTLLFARAGAALTVTLDRPRSCHAAVLPGAGEAFAARGAR